MDRNLEMVVFPMEAWRHGLPEFMPNSMTKMLSNSRPVTRMRQKTRPDDLNAADIYLWRMLWEAHGASQFERGYIDAGRLNRLFSREIVPVHGAFDPVARRTLLRLSGPPPHAN